MRSSHELVEWNVSNVNVCQSVFYFTYHTMDKCGSLREGKVETDRQHRQEIQTIETDRRH